MTARRRSLFLFQVLVVGAGLALGASNLPGAWYGSLQKPPFNPHKWVFAPSWTVLYVMIALAGWRTYLHDARGMRMQLWFAQMMLNFLWSPVVFRLRNLALGLAVILTLLVTIVSFIAFHWKEDRVAAGLFIPYAAWVALASLLNYSLFRLN
jgi:benzodiazapine receptor